MLVGSEGILGVITEAMVQCHPLRKHARVCFLSLRTDATMDCVRMLIERAKRHSVSQFIAAFELIDSKCMDLHQSLYPESAIFSQVQIGAYNVLMECEYDDEDYLDQHVNDFLASEMEGGLLADGVVSQNQKQAKEMWGIRESITTNLVHDKSKTLYKFDVSVHLEHLPMLQDRLAGHGLEVFYFGHLFDLNTHINILTPEPQPEGKIEGLVYEAVHECGGSFSAEHGIGAVKKKYLQQYDVKNQCSTLMLLKKAMDPHNILNPGVMV
jgi:FAD/FMN-containing dehydrogenase